MPGTIFVRWTIASGSTPKPVLHCRRCDAARPFESSGKFRLNANGKRLDAWLVYRCGACSVSWNRPIFERRVRSTVDPALLEALQRNDADLARKTALDVAGIKRWERGDGDAAISIAKAFASPWAEDADRLAIAMRVPAPLNGIRSDKVLALGLRLTRSAVGKLARDGRLAFEPKPTSALSKPMRDGQRVEITLEGLDNAARLLAAASGQGDAGLSAGPALRD